MILRKFITIICAAIFLSGCATLPINTSPVYYLEDLYKRINYKIDGQYRVLNIFYATCRDDGRALAKEVTYGDMDIRIDPRVRIGTVLPEQLEKNNVIKIKNTERLDADAFAKRLSEAVAASPHKSLLVLVFGYKDGLEATAIKAAYFSYLLDVNTPVLLFDWPGDQPVGIRGYKAAQSLAADSGPYLAEVLTKVIREVKPERIWIEASSLGCQVLCDAFDQMYKEPELADAETEIEHVILAAPDVGRDEFNVKFKEELLVLSKRLTTYVSSEDGALMMSGMINQDARLGRAKIRIKEPSQLQETRELLYLSSLSPEQFTLIDVTPVNHASFKHGYYLESPEFYDDFYMRIFNTPPGTNRSLYFLKFTEGGGYWVMQSSQ